MKNKIFRVAKLDVWSWLYGPPTKNVAHPCFRCICEFRCHLLRLQLNDSFQVNRTHISEITATAQKVV